LSPRDAVPPKRKGYLVKGCIKVGQRPTKVDITSSYLTVALPILKAADRQLRKLIKEARQQLPDDRLSAIIIEASQQSADVFLDSARQLISQPEYQNTPLLGIADGQTLHTVCRNDSPIDGDEFSA
jgi:hypothetical protein